MTGDECGALMADDPSGRFIDDCNGDSPAVRLILLIDRLLISPDLHDGQGVALDGRDRESRKMILENFRHLTCNEDNSHGAYTDFLDLYSYDPAGAAALTHGQPDFTGRYHVFSETMVFRMAMVGFALRHEDWAALMAGVLERLCAWSACHHPQGMMADVPSPAGIAGLVTGDGEEPATVSGVWPTLPVEFLTVVAKAVTSVFDSGGMGKASRVHETISPESVAMSMIMGTMVDDGDLASMRRSWPRSLEHMGVGDDSGLERLMGMLEQVLMTRMGDGPFSIFHGSLRKEPGYRLWIPPVAAFAMATHPLFGNGTSQAENDVAAAIRAIRTARIKAYILHGFTEDYDNNILPMPWKVVHGLVSETPADVLEAVVFRQTEVMAADSGGWSREDLERLGSLAESMLDEDWAAIDPEGMMRIAETLWPYGLHGEDTGITLPERGDDSLQVLSNVMNTTVADMLDDGPDLLGHAASRADMSALWTILKESCRQLNAIMDARRKPWEGIPNVAIPASALEEAVEGLGSGLPEDLIVQNLCAECMTTRGCIREQGFSDEGKGFRRIFVISVETIPGSQSVDTPELRFAVDWNL